MTPVNLDGCYAWLHTPEFESLGVGVILCPGIKLDELTGYGTLRLLAENSAAQGYPTLRLHYFGTGDSCDPDQPIEYWSTWQQNIHCAIDWMRAAGVSTIVLCGVRLGAMLAATVAAQRSDVSGLILLAPIYRGRTWVRQLKLESGHNEGDPLDLGRCQLSPETIALISRIELRKIPLPHGGRTAVFAEPSAALAECEATWRLTQAELTIRSLAGLEPILRLTFALHAAPADIQPVVSWLGPANGQSVTFRKPQTAPIETDRWTETPVFFGEDQSLFGVLCRPQGAEIGRAEITPVVLMVNQSGDPHCGGHTVNIARQLAVRGIASMRIDFAGLGDSCLLLNQHVFETDRRPDCSRAINALAGMGYRRFAIYGLCSGAYHAYHATASDPRITAAILINLPFFHWTTGFPVENLLVTRIRTRLGTRIFWLTVARKLMRGDLNLRSRLSRLNHKWQQRREQREHHQLITTLAKRAGLLFLVSEGDLSLDLLREAFGKARPPDGIEIELVPGLNHSMTRHALHKTVADLIAAFLDAGAGPSASAYQSMPPVPAEPVTT